MENTPKIIGVKQVLEDLKAGLTRWKKQNLGYGSIEEKYDLTFTQMKQLIGDERIKGARTVIPTLIIVDDADTYDKSKYDNFKDDDEVEEPANGLVELSHSLCASNEKTPTLTPITVEDFKETESEQNDLDNEPFETSIENLEIAF